MMNHTSFKWIFLPALLPLLFLSLMPAMAQENELTIQLHGQLANTTTRQIKEIITHEGRFDALFQAQKQYVYKLLGQFGYSEDQIPQEQKSKIGNHTKNFNAFVAFSMGVDLRDKGRYQEARIAFLRAIELDPKFEEARNQEQKTPLEKENISQLTERAVRRERKQSFLSMDRKRFRSPEYNPVWIKPDSSARVSVFSRTYDQTIKDLNQLVGSIANLSKSVNNKPEDAPIYLESAIKRNVSPALALETVLQRLEKPSEMLLKKIMNKAVDGGITAKQTDQVITQLKNTGLCK